MPKIIVIGHLFLVIVENVVTCFLLGHGVDTVDRRRWVLRCCDDPTIIGIRPNIQNFMLVHQGIDTGIGNACLSPKIFNTFQQDFFKNSFPRTVVLGSLSEYPPSLLEVEHWATSQCRSRTSVCSPSVNESSLLFAPVCPVNILR